MAIQMRRGASANFAPSRLLPGEWAVVMSGDETPMGDGTGIYLCVASGTTKRIATADELYKVAADAGMTPEWAQRTARLIEQLQETVNGYVISVGGDVDGETLVLSENADVGAYATDLEEARERIAALEDELASCCEQVNAELNDAIGIVSRLANVWLVQGGELFAPNAACMSVSGAVAAISGAVASEVLTVAA